MYPPTKTNEANFSQVTFCPQHPVQNRQPCHQLTLEVDSCTITFYVGHKQATFCTLNASQIVILFSKTTNGVVSCLSKICFLFKFTFCLPFSAVHTFNLHCWQNGEWVIHRQRQLPFWDHARGALVTYHSRYLNVPTGLTFSCVLLKIHFSFFLLNPYQPLPAWGKELGGS